MARYAAVEREGRRGLRVLGLVVAADVVQALEQAQAQWPGCGVLPPRAFRVWALAARYNDNFQRGRQQ